MLNSPVYPLKSPLQLTEARKTHFKHLTHTNYRVMSLKVYNASEGFLEGIPRRSQLVEFSNRNPILDRKPNIEPPNGTN